MAIIVLSVWILFVVAYVMAKLFFPNTGTGVRPVKDIKGVRTYGEDGYDHEGFSALGYHRNGTRYDDEGYDRDGLDVNGNPRPVEDEEDEAPVYDSPDLDETKPVSSATRTKIMAVVMAAVTVILLAVTVVDNIQKNNCIGGHNYVKTFCEMPEKCSRCGTEKDKPLGHTWIKADCEHPQTCSFCRKQEGEPLGHTTDSGECERCGKTVE